MIVSMYHTASQGNAPHEVPNSLVAEFVNQLLNSSAWKFANAEGVMERCLKFRKQAFEQAKFLEPVLAEPVPADGKIEPTKDADRASAKGDQPAKGTGRGGSGPARPSLAP